MAATSRDMVSTSLRKYFESVVCQIYTRNSHKSVKNHGVVWYNVLANSFQEYTNGVERNLNPRFRMAISVRRFE